MSLHVRVPVLPLWIPTPTSRRLRVTPLPFVLWLCECRSLGTGSLPLGPVRRGPENNGGPTLHTGLGWAGLSFQLPALFTSFLRKGKLDGGQRPGFQAGPSVVLALPGAGGKARWALSGRALPPGTTGPHCPCVAGPMTPPVAARHPLQL